MLSDDIVSDIAQRERAVALKDVGVKFMVYGVGFRFRV